MLYITKNAIATTPCTSIYRVYTEGGWGYLIPWNILEYISQDTIFDFDFRFRFSILVFDFAIATTPIPCIYSVYTEGGRGYLY
jgi:hypothetical protein